MRTNFQPHIHTELRHRTDCRGEFNGLPHATGPMPGHAGQAVEPPAGDRAEKWQDCGFWRQIEQRRVQRVGGGLHHCMVKWVTYLQEAGEKSLRFQLGGDGFQRGPET